MEKARILENTLELYQEIVNSFPNFGISFGALLRSEKEHRRVQRKGENCNFRASLSTGMQGTRPAASRESFAIIIINAFVIDKSIFEMKYCLLFILGLHSFANGQGNRVDWTNIEIHKDCSINELFPPEFLIPAQVSIYFKESTNGEVLILKLRGDCRFIYEYHYLPYDSALLNLRIGNYLVKGDTILFSYERIVEPSDDLMHTNHIPLVSWTLPFAPAYLMIKNGKLYEPLTKKYKRKYNSLNERLYYFLKKLKRKPKQKNYFTLKDDVQFELYKCK